MNAPLVRLGCAGTLLALAGLFGTLLLRQRQDELRQLEESVREEGAANRQQRRILRSAQARAASAAPVAMAPAAPAAARPAPPATNLARGSRLADELRSLPEYAPFEQRRLRRSTLRRYSELLAELKLASEREEAFKRILDERLGEGIKALRIASQEGHGQGSKEHARLQQQVSEAAEAKIAALLSDEEKAVYARFEKSLSWRSVQQPELDELVADRGLPSFSPAQKQALAAAYYEARNWKPDPTGGPLADVALQQRRNEEMAKLAAATLDPRQRAVLADYLAFHHARGEILGRLYFPEKPAGSVFVAVSYQRP